MWNGWNFREVGPTLLRKATKELGLLLQGNDLTKLHSEWKYEKNGLTSLRITLEAIWLIIPLMKAFEKCNKCSCESCIEDKDMGKCSLVSQGKIYMDVNPRNNWPCSLKKLHNGLNPRKFAPFPWRSCTMDESPNKWKHLGKLHNEWEKMKFMQFLQGNGMVDETPLSNYPRFKFVVFVPTSSISIHCWIFQKFQDILSYLAFEGDDYWEKGLSGKN